MATGHRFVVAHGLVIAGCEASVGSFTESLDSPFAAQG